MSSKSSSAELKKQSASTGAYILPTERVLHNWVYSKHDFAESLKRKDFYPTCCCLWFYTALKQYPSEYTIKPTNKKLLTQYNYKIIKIYLNNNFLYVFFKYAAQIKSSSF